MQKCHFAVDASLITDIINTYKVMMSRTWYILFLQSFCTLYIIKYDSREMNANEKNIDYTSTLKIQHDDRNDNHNKCFIFLMIESCKNIIWSLCWYAAVLDPSYMHYTHTCTCVFHFVRHNNVHPKDPNSAICIHPSIFSTCQQRRIGWWMDTLKINMEKYKKAPSKKSFFFFRFYRVTCKVTVIGLPTLLHARG